MLPAQWQHYRFKIQLRGTLLQVRVARGQAEYTLLQGGAFGPHPGGGTGMSRFKAVIFDLDGVITDTAHYHYLAWRALAESEGVHFDHAFNENLKGVDRLGSLELILAGSAKTYTQEDKLALADRKNRQYQELISTMSEAGLLPGAVDALATVRPAGREIGLASVSKNAFTVLETG